MLQKLYEWTLSLASRPMASFWLAFIAFVESSVFLIPADVLFVPMGLAKRQAVYRYALIATLASVFGGIAGWFLGFYAYEIIARPVLEFYGKLNYFETLRATKNIDTILLLLISSGLAHVPPIKVVTILSGAMEVNIWLFIILAIIARGARFFFLAWLLHRFGNSIVNFIEKRLTLMVSLGMAALILGYFIVQYLFFI